MAAVDHITIPGPAVTAITQRQCCDLLLDPVGRGDEVIAAFACQPEGCAGVSVVDDELLMGARGQQRLLCGARGRQHEIGFVQHSHHSAAIPAAAYVYASCCRLFAV